MPVVSPLPPPDADEIVAVGDGPADAGGGAADASQLSGSPGSPATRHERQARRPVESSGFRPDIEGLRAVAVLLVLAYHADLGPFPGGYIGVDVFFVLSGFLITSLLMRELQSSGQINLPRFWARRARRLLPASCLVIVATLVGGYLALNPLAQVDLGRDALAAATFVVNIVFAKQQSNYLTADLAPSPLLHFWSLAVEEQFYLVWPALLLLVAGRRRRSRGAAIGLVAVVWPVSLAACVWLTTSSQPWAFFSFPTRAWELLTGAALALGAAKLARVPGALRAAMGWAGVIGVIAVAVTFSTATKFPGIAALLPVLATTAVVAAGAGVTGGPGRLLGTGPLQWVGRHSYSIYLWHWPALVLVTARLGPLVAWQRVVVLVGSIVVAVAAQRLLEDPVRHSAWLAAKARRGLTLGAGLIGIGVAASFVAVAAAPAVVGSGVAAAAPVLVATPSTPPTTPTPVTTARPPGIRAAVSPTTTPATATTRPGPDQLAAANAGQLVASLATKAVPANLRPSLRAAKSDLPTIYNDGCHLDATVTQPPPCVFGDPASATTVALFGDSHAAQWFPALDDIAKRHGWRLLVLTKKGCPTADIAVFSPMVNRELTECGAWRKNVVDRLAAERPALIVMSSYRYRQTGSWATVEPNEAWRRGLDATMTALRPLATEVLVLGDTPTPSQDVPSCLSGRLGNVPACVTPRDQAVREDRLAVERAVTASHDAAFVSTSDWLCAPEGCPVVIGDVLVYRDANHITATAATFLAPYVEAAVVGLVDP